MAAETNDTSASLDNKTLSDAQAGTGRNLIVCIDGTSNGFGSKNTNVIKLFNAIDLNATRPKQYAYYSSGIGTRTKSQAVCGAIDCVIDKIDMMFACTVDKNVKEAYGWLAGIYEKGDRIFLFGFSRGAYQVRVLAGMIYEVGLIRTRTERQIATAYDHYEAIQPGKPGARQLARKFKKTFCWDGLTVHFVGVWDTVSSVGLCRKDVSIPMSSPANHFRHALALDERRVNFVPEYSRETDLNPSLDVRHVRSPDSKQLGDVKEVWFAGYHSDVGGQQRPGNTHHAGNISLSWMYREATEHGLVLRPTDITWGSDDISFGTKNSMKCCWRICECFAFKQPGPWKDVRSMHCSKPRLIMPHQKVHASILHTDAYKPAATPGRGFNISMIYGTSEGTQLDEHFWENNLFCDVEAQELVESLHRLHSSATDKLLFMLQFDQGKQLISKVPGCQEKLRGIIEAAEYAFLNRLVAVVAYYEAAFHPSLGDIITKVDGHFIEDGKFNPRMVTLLGPLTRHEDLRTRFLTPEVLEYFVKLVDSTVTTELRRIRFHIGPRENNFVQVMKGLDSLLRCENTRKWIAPKLWEKGENPRRRRLSRILQLNDPQLLTAALHMMLTLARLPIDKASFLFVKPRIESLAKTNSEQIGALAVEIWLEISMNPELPSRVYNARVRANTASAFVRTSTNILRPADAENTATDSGGRSLASVFALNPETLNKKQEKLLTKFIEDARNCDDRVCTTMTITLLELCKTPVFQKYLCKRLVDTLVDQLKHKNRALLAAYALATCLKDHPDMRKSIEENKHLPKRIVKMLREDYFDNAIGQVEGLSIFVQLMRHSTLKFREKVMNRDMMEVLAKKAHKGQLKRIPFFHHETPKNSSDSPNAGAEDPFKNELVKMSLEFLEDLDWKVQKTGVTVLTALAQTLDGQEIIKRNDLIPKIIRMILPDAINPQFRSASSVMGPVFMLQNLALIGMCQSLRSIIRNTTEYMTLKSAYLSQRLIDAKETKPWHPYDPMKSDINTILDKVISIVDGKLPEEVGIADMLPPDVQHWDRALLFLAKIASFPVLLGASAIILAVGLAVEIALVAALVGTLGLSVVAVPIALIASAAYSGLQSCIHGPTQSDAKMSENEHVRLNSDLVWLGEDIVTGVTNTDKS